MKTITTCLLLLCALAAYQSLAQQFKDERPATLKFLRGNWRIEETRVIGSLINKDSTIKHTNDISKGFPYQVLSLKNDGQTIEYSNLMGREYPKDFQDRIDGYTLMAGSYALENGVLALKAINDSIKPEVIYFYPIAAGDKLLLKMDLDLLLKNKIIEEGSEEIKRVISANMILVMSRVKGKIPKYQKGKLEPGELSNVDENDVSGIDEPR